MNRPWPDNRRSLRGGTQWCIARSDCPDLTEPPHWIEVDIGLLTPERLHQRVGEAAEWCRQTLPSHRPWELWATYHVDYMGILGPAWLEFRTLTPDDGMLVRLSWE
jgi:hypothetical protein